MNEVDLVFGGIDCNHHFLRRSAHPSLIFHGSIEDMPFFTPYYRDSWLPVIDRWLNENQLSPLTMIYSIKYEDIKNPNKMLTTWIAYSDDKSVGWYKYEGLTKGGIHQTLLYEGNHHELPSRSLMHPRVRRV